jgi:ABC-2 type transport system permease protein
VWNRILALVIKELLVVLKDVKTRVVLIGLPLAQLIVFGYAATFDVDHIAFALYNEDPSAPARELAARFEGSPTFHEIARVHSDGEIAPLVDSGKVLMAIHIDRRFSRDLLQHRSGNLQLVVDGRNSNTALIALGYVNTMVTDFSLEWAKDHGGQGAPAVLSIRARYNPNLDSQWFIVPGIVAQLTQVVTIMLVALLIAGEREAGTFDQLLVTPMTPFELLLGKSLPGLVIGVAEATVTIIAAVLWFRTPLRGGLFPLYLGLFIFLFAIIGIGLVISALSVTQQQGLLGAFMFLPSFILSGFATPIATMPQVLQDAAYLNPMRYFLIIVRCVFLQQATTGSLVSEYWPMAVIALVTLTAAGLTFRLRMY